MTSRPCQRIFWPEFAVPLEAKLRSLGIGGITLSKVRGFGEYRNYFSGDGLTEHTKVEIFVDDDKVEALLAALRDVYSEGFKTCTAISKP